ncbi:nuclear receptor-binding protein homolog [Drosophila sulfurigaster albostrigata]|uniref:nuclear receptor-binding protein homolog n=1 Tax=Drosophila sulfurigaster albostrigata TaxID=89887 RepID=UPI002D21A3B8|nr:nuclear receptor-binding protein homolog [Drosophila sulfurigaster albostrigata]
MSNSQANAGSSGSVVDETNPNPSPNAANPASVILTTTSSTLQAAAAAGASTAAAGVASSTTTTATTTTGAPGTTATSATPEGGAVPNLAVDSSPRESGDDSEDESEILEESPCGRWLKRREEVDQRDVPGIDCVHLAMDTEEGVEVVWNEVQYAQLQELKTQEDKMRQVFDNLLQLDHQNIVKFHRYWTDISQAERPRVIFITEYMSSGSLKQFLKRTKRNAKRLPLESWRRWCTQILSALSYLHSCSPPIIHGNLTCDSIFIQHNGLVKIGSVVPDAVHYSVRRQHLEQQQREREREREQERGGHYFHAPEYGAAEQLTAAVDIYAFGMCALEMAALEIQPQSSNSESTAINEETILRTINSLDNDLQRDLILKCLNPQPQDRPSASDLLFHPLLFEVHSLKLLAAHCLVFSPANRTMFSETAFDGLMQRYNHPDVIMAQLNLSGSTERLQFRLSDVPGADKLEKFVEDVKYGVYPLITYSGKKPPHFRSRAASPERADSVKSATPEPVDTESRRIVNMMCSVKKLKEDSNDILMTILLRMDDKMNRQLTCQVNEEDTAADLTSELVRLGFVHLDDQDKIEVLLGETLRAGVLNDGAGSESSGAGVTTTATMAALEQLERNWSISDADKTMTSSMSVNTSPSSAALMYVPQQEQQPGEGGAEGTPILNSHSSN